MQRRKFDPFSAFTHTSRLHKHNNELNQLTDWLIQCRSLSELHCGGLNSPCGGAEWWFPKVHQSRQQTGTAMCYIVSHVGGVRMMLLCVAAVGLYNLWPLAFAFCLPKSGWKPIYQMIAFSWHFTLIKEVQAVLACIHADTVNSTMQGEKDAPGPDCRHQIQ